MKCSEPIRASAYFNYCEPDGSRYYGKTRASKNYWCYKYYTEYHKKWNNGKKYYYVHVYYKWRTPDSIRHTQDYWYYSQYHKYDDPKRTHPYFKAWVTYKPTGNHYWESFYWYCPKC